MAETNCKWMEMKPQASEQQLRTLIETVTHLIAIADERGIIRYCSPSVQKLLGYALDEMEGRALLNLVHPTDTAHVWQLLDHAIQQPTVNQPAIACRLQHCDGSWRWFEVAATSLVDDPGIQELVINCYEVTRQQQVEADLQRANQRIETILECLSEAYISLNQDWRVTYVNRNAAHLLQRSPDQLIGQNLYDAFPEFEHTLLHQRCHDALKQQTSVTFEEFYSFLDTWYKVRVFPTVDGLAIFFVDITERQQAQAELLEMSTALGNAVEGIARLDTQGRYTSMNRAYATMLGYDQSEIVGRSWQATVHPEDLPIVKAAYYQMLLEGKSKVETRALRKDGSVFYKEVVMVAAYDWYVQFIGHHCFTRDITERTDLYRQVQQLNISLEHQVQERTAQLQQALHSEAMLKRIADSVRDSLDEDQIMQNTVQELALGLDVVGCDAAIYDLEQQTSTIRYEYMCSNIPLAKGAIIQMSDYTDLYRQLLQGQHFQFCRIQVDRIRPLKHEHTAFVCPIVDNQRVIGDLWLFKHHTEGFSELEIRLVQQVANQCAIAIRQARLYQATQDQVAALEELNQLKDDFLSTVSHELRTPISNMKMAIHMLKSIHTPERQTRYLEILQSECSREIELINDLLDLQRLEASSYPLTPSLVDLQQSLSNLVQPFQSRVQEREQVLFVDLPATLLPMTTDQATLERILAELLNNACKYTPPGGKITLSVQQTAEKLNHVAQTTFTVCNQASIPKSELPHIFDKFYRVPNGDRWKQGGTGLGLALVKHLITELEGTIQVESDNDWTTFTVQLKCSQFPPC